MKGRGNYLCLHRFAAKRDDIEAGSPADRVYLEMVDDWATSTTTGDRAELADLPEDVPFWAGIAATSENCVGSECPEFDDCFVTRMRQRAAASDVVIVNHHLLCADAAVRQGTYGEVIPEAPRRHRRGAPARGRGHAARGSTPIASPTRRDFDRVMSAGRDGPPHDLRRASSAAPVPPGPGPPRRRPAVAGTCAAGAEPGSRSCAAVRRDRPSPGRAGETGAISRDRAAQNPRRPAPLEARPRLRHYVESGPRQFRRLPITASLAAPSTLAAVVPLAEGSS
jgi:hypothetical protein